jgi:dihydrolipoamide dehydrogenase
VATFDVIVIGGGPAGYVCAIRCAQLGLGTAIVEREKLGGVCVNIGCIPTKALLHSAYILNTVRHGAKDLGIETGEVKGDYGTAMRRSRKVSEQNSRGVESLMKKHRIAVLKGEGVLLAGKQVKVGGETHAAGKAVVIATGSRTKGIPQIGLELDRTTVISSDEALFLEQAPRSMAIVGAGAVGCEFADIFNAFGSQVTLIEALPRILPLEDAEASDALAKAYRKRGITMHVGARVLRATVVEVEVAGKTQTVEAEKVLMAAGRALNTETLGLAEAGVQLTERGFVKVDAATLETTAAGVYCIGDVAGPPMLAHKGSREGVHVAEIIAGHHPRPIDYRNVPNVTYCHPEVASVGLTEQDAKAKGMEVRVGRFPFSANGRARTAGETDGFVKIVRDTKYGEIIGAHIVGSHASELIHELVVAKTNEYTVEEVDLAIHAHPTLSEAVAEAALDSLGRVLHI